MCALFRNALLYAILLPATHPSLIYDTAKDSAVISPSKTFEFAYETRDEEGNMKMHREVQDHMGHRKGTYGYRNSNGLYRFVDYIADNFGYRVTVRTNEPGTSSVLGAHVTVQSNPGPDAPEDTEFHRPRSAPISERIPLIPLRSSRASGGTSPRSLLLQSAVLFPAPPMIRPPRYKPRSVRVASSNFIEAAFRKTRI